MSDAPSPAPTPLELSSAEYDKIYEKTKMPKRDPEIIEDVDFGGVKDRAARLRTEQGTMLRKKHVPPQLLDALESHSLRDTTRGKPVGFEHNFGRQLKPPRPDPNAALSKAHHISSKAYDEIYSKIKMEPKEPEIVTSNNPGGATMRRKAKEPFTLQERMARLQTEQGDSLRKKHVPERLQTYLEKGGLKDTTRGVDVGFEFNFKEAGKPLPKARGEPSKALEKSSKSYDQVYQNTKMAPKDPEIESTDFGPVRERTDSLRSNQGKPLRKKHLPDRLKNVSIKDLPGQRTVGFEWNMYGPSANVARH